MNLDQILDDVRAGRPVARYVTPVAIAAENGVAVVIAGNNSILQIKRIVLQNEAAAARKFTIHVAGFSAVSAALNNVVDYQFVDLAARDFTAAPRAISMAKTASRAGTFGNTVYGGTTPANTSLELSFPDPGIILYGDVMAGPSALLVVNTTVNDQFTASFFGREFSWPERARAL